MTKLITQRVPNLQKELSLDLSSFGTMPASRISYFPQRASFDRQRSVNPALRLQARSYRPSTWIHPLHRHQPINPAQNFRKSSSCHHGRSDWPRTAQLVLPRIRPTSVQRGLNFLQAIDTLFALTAQHGLRHACALSNPYTLLTGESSSTIGLSFRCVTARLHDISVHPHSKPPRHLLLGTARAIGRLGPDGIVDQWQWRRATIAMEWD